jgi:hypothetical protein
VSPYRFFRPTLGRTDDFDKFNRETLSVEPTYPRKFRSFSSILRFFSLNLLQIFYEALCTHLGHRKLIMWLQGHHRSDRWCAPVRPVLPWENDFEPQGRFLLTDKRRIPLRSASVRTPHLFHHGIPKVLVNPRSKGITSVQSTSMH